MFLATNLTQKIVKSFLKFNKTFQLCDLDLDKVITF